MKLKVKHSIYTSFSMSSMTDIVFLLLLFFMLSVSFVPPLAVHIDLPTSEHANTNVPDVKVLITSNQLYYVNDEQIDKSQLKEVLSKKLSHPNQLLLLQIDRLVAVQHMVQVVDIANSLQAQVSIATQPD